MAKIDPNTVEAVRQSADLAELVAGRVALVRRGGRLWGPCPFHDERTASFSLIPPDSRRYFCFGCGATGDAITWMMEREGAGSFQEAVEALAERFGVPVRYDGSTPEQDAARREADRRLELLDRACAFYVNCLWSGDEAAPARDYLLGRGFEEDLLRRYRVGYAPASGSALSTGAARQGFTREQLADCGLSRTGRGGVTDFFQGRVMFPIADARGRVLGFGGRVMPGADGPKYVNSPEGPRFRKRELLFGLHEARAVAAKTGWVCVVEGYTDVLALAAAGVESAVACMGTSLTSQQLRELKRVAGEVRLCFDGDAAGESAARRTHDARRGIPLRLSALRLPAGSDPGDLASRPGGLAALREIVERPEPLVVALVRSRCSRADTTAAGRDEAFADIEAILSAEPASMERDEAVRVAIGLLSVPPSLAARLEAGAAARPSGPSTVSQSLGRDEELERRVLVLAVALPRVGAEELRALPEGSFEVPGHREAAEQVAAGRDVAQWPEHLRALGHELRARAGESESVEELREAVLRLQERALERRLATARAASDEAAVVRIQALLARVRGAIRGGGA